MRNPSAAESITDLCRLLNDHDRRGESIPGDLFKLPHWGRFPFKQSDTAGFFSWDEKSDSVLIWLFDREPGEMWLVESASHYR